jgi:hypothetical protein
MHSEEVNFRSSELQGRIFDSISNAGLPGTLLTSDPALRKLPPYPHPHTPPCATPSSPPPPPPTPAPPCWLLLSQRRSRSPAAALPPRSRQRSPPKTCGWPRSDGQRGRCRSSCPPAPARLRAGMRACEGGGACAFSGREAIVKSTQAQTFPHGTLPALLPRPVTSSPTIPPMRCTAATACTPPRSPTCPLPGSK